MSTTHSLEGYDQEQVKLLEEMVILTDPQDRNIGYESKKNSHLVENIKKGMLHRAFSVFLFNSKGELLLQQRAKEKITFPAHWTNTCCSHPLSFPDEIIEKDQLGVRTAAIRKLEHELGIPQTTFEPQDFTYLTRLHYEASSDETWGEHEIDYILFVKRDVHLNINNNEVMAYRYVTPQQLKELFQQDGLKITPWFKLIVENFIFKWWEKLEDLSSFQDPSTIHKLN
uniref:isopentenyl-diphosphate Delta-isomerase n=1 Tax=Arcella intermedia TaxID=1963864 RepID=A0A6B2LGU1_9EUKA|eukprot:TRINITY_DN1891_c0_g1_i1.p1 TRINITY_DN1891_c0_g1~~TRINITY_DN1891_c0_g1_i1.p1  ORF type:complete len:240 (-),score=68.36 TRINITY_DN1891_c0_g1_i1:74-754(-)